LPNLGISSDMPAIRLLDLINFASLSPTKHFCNGLLRPATVLAVAMFLLSDASSAQEAMFLRNDCQVRLLDQEEGRQTLGIPDEFATRMGDLERQFRMHSDQPVSTDRWIQFVQAEVLDWSPAFREKIAKCIHAVGAQLKGYPINLPDKIVCILTTGDEEGGAAYCRGQNIIVLPRGRVTGTVESLQDLFTHELFHIISRNNLELRPKMYAVVGFQPCGMDVVLPEDLFPRRLTNPDAPRYNYRIPLMLDGNIVNAMPLLLLRYDKYEPSLQKKFFHYMQFRLLLIRKQSDRWEAVVKNGKPVLLRPREVSSYLEKVGRNTGYIIHPEEILADNFKFLLQGRQNLPSPKIINQLRDILSRG